MRWKKLQYIATGLSDHLGRIAKDANPQIHEAMWNHIMSIKEWDLLELRDIWECAPTFQCVRSAFPEGEYGRGASPILDISKG